MGVSEGRRGYRPNVDGNSRKDDEEEYHGRASDWQHPARKAFCIVNESFFFAEASTADSRVLRPCSAYAHLVRCLHSTLPCFTKIRLHAAKKLQRIAFIVNCGVTNIRESDGCPAARAAGFGGSVRP
jgi:hypothetical protein